MQVLAEENGAWLFFGEGQTMYLSVLCGSIAMYGINIQLTQAEANEFSARGTSYLAELAQDVSRHSDKYGPRHMPEFTNMVGVREAIATWRKQRSSGS